MRWSRSTRSGGPLATSTAIMDNKIHILQADTGNGRTWPVDAASVLIIVLVVTWSSSLSKSSMRPLPRSEAYVSRLPVMTTPSDLVISMAFVRTSMELLCGTSHPILPRGFCISQVVVQLGANQRGPTPAARLWRMPASILPAVASRLYLYMRNWDGSLARFVTKPQDFTPAMALGFSW